MQQQPPSTHTSPIDPSSTTRLHNPQERRWWKTWLLRLGGGVCTILATLGAVLPILPTTPFLLAASFFFVRSSPRMNDALLRSRLFGPLLRDWQIGGGVRPAVKLQAMVTVVLVVGGSLWWTRPDARVAAAILMLAAIGLTVVWKLPIAEHRPSADEDQLEDHADE